MKSKIYIAGKITGDPEYRHKFKCAAYELRECRRSCSANKQCNGCVFYDRDYLTSCRISSVFPDQLEIVNPSEFDVKGRCYWRIMLYCIRQVIKCDYVFMLKDWQDSKGARKEHRVAKWFHKNIIYQQ